MKVIRLNIYIPSTYDLNLYIIISVPSDPYALFRKKFQKFNVPGVEKLSK